MVAISKISKIYELLIKGDFKKIKDSICDKSYKSFLSIGLIKQIDVAAISPKAKIDINLREIKQNDIDKIFSRDLSEFSEADRYELEIRKKFLDEKLGFCYVATDSNDEPCYFQWLILAKDNQRIQKVFNKRFPWLKEDQALLENAFTMPKFRGLGIMPAAMAQIAEKAKELGVSSVITFVEHDNIPSLKGCHKAGFERYLVRKDKWFLHPKIRSLKFVPYREDDPQLLLKVASA